MTIYIDESGDNGTASQYIVFGVLATDSERAIEKLVKKVWLGAPRAATNGELHANRADDATKRKLLTALSGESLRCYYSAIEKSRLKIAAIDAYYLELARIIQLFQPVAGTVIVDKKETDRKRMQILARLGLGETFKLVRFEQSHDIKQLQAVDFVAWAVGRYFERHDNTYLAMIPGLSRLETKRKPLAFPDR